jgi:lipopolysaccharide/colanic/teichoic acid biosynthesis glycosyltransferase
MTVTSHGALRIRCTRILLPVADGCALLLGAVLSGAARDLASTDGNASLSGIGALLLPAALAAYMLHDARIADKAGASPRSARLGGLVLRLSSLAVILATLGWISPVVSAVPAPQLLAWLGIGLVLTTGAHLAAQWFLRQRPPARGGTQSGAARLVAGFIAVRLLADRPIRNWDAVSKATFDLLLGGFLTLLLLPLLAAIAVVIRLTSPGPVLYRQRRHSLDNREFDIFKFRTMHWNPVAVGDCLLQTRRNDPRITPIGRFLRASSLDELPQLFNVLAGDMSLVGPRPHAVDMRTADLLGSEITHQYALRHRVRPGITGWSQVNGARGATQTAEQLRRRVELDLAYIDNWSLLLDVKILALTTRAVLRPTNAF